MIVSKFEHRIMIDAYIRLYLTHTDLQINVCLNVKSLTVNLLQVFIFYYLCLGIIPIGACNLCLYFSFITF